MDIEQVKIFSLINVGGYDSIADLEEQINNWLQEESKKRLIEELPELVIMDCQTNMTTVNPPSGVNRMNILITIFYQ
ncbi:MAG: hypothetical protein Q7K65_01465 [Candidatus Buchananbacteria bacterium]|nr:hypothetical protein [Candidatus Buchananbacteria bacterium]